MWLSHGVGLGLSGRAVSTLVVFVSVNIRITDLAAAPISRRTLPYVRRFGPTTLACQTYRSYLWDLQ